MNQEISKELSHLSSEQIEELYSMYLEGVKNQELIELYEIDTNPNNLIKLFPPLEHKDETCPYCNVFMYSKRRSKSSYSDPKIKCYTCKHIAYQQNRYGITETCYCKNCREIHEQQQIEQKSLTERYITEKYKIDNYEPVLYSSLNFNHKLYLLTLFKTQTDEEFEYIQALSDHTKVLSLTPTEVMDIELLRYLYRDKVIIVDPDSNIDCFVIDEDSNDYGAFYVSNVRYIVNVSFDEGNRASLADCFNLLYIDFLSKIKPEWEEQVEKITFKIALEEIIKNVYFKSEELNVNFSADNKTREVVMQLLENFSVSEIYYFVKRSVENAHIYYSKGFSHGKKHAGNTIPGKMLELGERALIEKWDTYKYNRNSRTPRSAISVVFHDLLFQGNDDGFHKAPKLFWEGELLPKYFAGECEPENQNMVACVNCGSININTSMDENKIIIECEDCKNVNTYSAS